MAQANRRAQAQTAVSKAAIDHAHSLLEQLPEKPKENLTLREAFAQLQGGITAAVDKGYSLEEIATLLTDQGIETNAPSLKYYLSRLKKDQAPTTRRTRRTRKTTTRRGKKADQDAATTEPAENLKNGTAVDSIADMPDETSDEAPPVRRRGRGRASSAAPTTEAAEVTTRAAAKAKPAATKTTSTRGRRRTRTDES